MQLQFLDKTVLNLILHLYVFTKNVIHACFTTMRCLGNKPVKISYWARTTVTFPIDDHYNILAPTLKIYPTIFFLIRAHTRVILDESVVTATNGGVTSRSLNNRGY